MERARTRASGELPLSSSAFVEAALRVTDLVIGDGDEAVEAAFEVGFASVASVSCACRV